MGNVSRPGQSARSENRPRRFGSKKLVRLDSSFPTRRNFPRRQKRLIFGQERRLDLEGVGLRPAARECGLRCGPALSKTFLKGSV